MNLKVDRRTFLRLSAAGLALSGSRTRLRAARAGQRLVVGVMGTGGRGSHLAAVFQQQPDVEVAYVCDVDQAHAAQAAGGVAKVAGARPPKVVGDFRRILDDRAVDVLVAAACNHWHAPATILACQAGKHVYVEKPCSHNPREGEWMVAAARKHKRLVQMGAQRRSWPAIMQAIELVRGGVIGRVYHAQSWYTSNRLSIGHGKPSPIPPGLDYELWQGPAPRRPFKDNILPYNWHWFWHWGNGELGNNGVHMLDVCRWGMGVDYPVGVSSTGGRFRFADDQETPDTNVVTFNFDDAKMIRWEGLSCNKTPGAQAPEVRFLGENGSLEILGPSYTVYDADGKELRKFKAAGNDEVHISNFLRAVREQEKLHCEIEEGAKSTLMCHLGNISYRTGRALRCSPTDGRILDDARAAQMWGRSYAPGWEKMLKPV